MMRYKSPVAWCWLQSLVVAVSLGAVGCLPSGPERHAVSGTVTLDGEPVNAATVIFTPQESAGLASAAQIINGKFTVDPANGPTPGTHEIQVIPDQPEMELTIEDPSELIAASRKPTVPKAYQLPGMLTAEVVNGENAPMVFELHSRP